MNKTILIAAMAIALVAPYAIADPTTPGVPDFTCQTAAEWNTHDYAAPTGVGLVAASDNNLDECGNTYGWFFLSDADCAELWALIQETPPGPARDALVATYKVLCETDRPADYDGDYEFAHGGALLVSRSGSAGSPTGQGTTGAGGVVCYSTTGHHPAFATVYVHDAVLPNATFTVTSDWSRPELVVDGEPDCGDGTVEPCNPGQVTPSDLPPPANEVHDAVRQLLRDTLNEPGVSCNADDGSRDCLNLCAPAFGPGADGAYWVFVWSCGDAVQTEACTGGHIWTF